MKLVLLGQPQDGLAAVAAQLQISLDPSIQWICCDTLEQAPAWSALEANDLVLLVEHVSAACVEWRQALMSSKQGFQVIHLSTEPLWQELQWTLGHHLRRTTGNSPWPLRTEIAPRWQGVCDKCSDPECEHQLFRQLMSKKRQQDDNG